MSETVLSLILLAVYFIVYVVKHIMKEHPDVKGTPIENDPFPETGASWFGVSEENTEDKAAVNKSVKKTVVPIKTAEKNKQKAVPESTVVDAGNDKVLKTSLRNRSEAKRAFIHAEILNRKY